MNWYKHSVNIKAGLFVIGIVLVFVFVLFTHRIVKDLRDDNREIVKLYAELIAGVAKDENDEGLNFIFENIIQKVRFPLIQSDTKMNPVSWRNLPNNVRTPEQASNILRTMDYQNNPITLEYVDPLTKEVHILGYLHFGDSLLINKLKWLPYIQIGLVGLFILLGFVGFNVIRNSEKKHIWAGMARETAHQLGTPVSALMGWVDILKNNPKNINSVVKDVEIDLERLQEISDRFSDMGTKIKLVEVDLVDMINSVISYLQHRIPETKIEFKYNSKIVYKYHANRKLLSWAIENIIKNGIDATKGKIGKIIIKLVSNNGSFEIYINDNGSGIPRRDWKNIFRPGFSTKKYGWGLGLSLTNRIIKDFHKGKLFVKESVIGKGTTICIILR